MAESTEVVYACSKLREMKSEWMWSQLGLPQSRRCKDSSLHERACNAQIGARFQFLVVAETVCSACCANASKHATVKIVVKGCGRLDLHHMPMTAFCVAWDDGAVSCSEGE